MEDEIVNKVFDNYINEKDRIQLIEDARTFHYSETKILNVEKLFNNFNTDTIEYNTAIDIIEMETHIYDHYQKEGVFSKISNIVISEDEQ